MTGEEASDGSARAGRKLWLTAALVLAMLPFVAVEFVPATDLPQHVAQVRLLAELWGLEPRTVDTSLLDARPFGANTLVYAPLFLLSRLCEPRLAGKLTVLAIVLGSVFALHQLAAQRKRDGSQALLASVLLFSAPLYWGFLNFVAGLPLWLWFVARALDERAERPSARRALADGALICLLYWAHVFWVLAALLTSLLRLPRATPRRALLAALAFVPAGLLMLHWYPQLVSARSAAGFSLQSFYLVPLAERFSFHWLFETLFGGVRGALEPLATAALLSYAAWALLRPHARHAPPSGGVDRPLAGLALLFALVALFAPDQQLNTILLNRRFLPVAGLLFVLALPAACGRGQRFMAASSAVVFALWTTFAWTLFDQVDLTGYRESLALVRPGQSVLGLDYWPESPYLRERPFLQLSAYAQAAHGGELAFSFAEHASSVVVYKEPRQLRWTAGLEWLPERATRADIAAFDCVLVHGIERDHAAFVALSGRSSPQRQSPFRAYCR